MFPLDSPESPILDDTQPIITMPRSARYRYVRWLIITLGVLIAGLAVVMTMLTLTDSRPQDPSIAITLIDTNQMQTIETDASTVVDLLNAQNIDLNSSDIVTPGLATPLTDAMTITIERARSVTISVDDTTTVIRTTLLSPDSILQSAGITVMTSDRIRLDGTGATVNDLVTWPVPVNTITVERAVSVTIIDGDRTIPLDTIRETVGEALTEANVVLYEADSVLPDVATLLDEGMQIVVDRSRLLTIVIDGQRIETRTAGSTVGEALANAGVVLDGLDYAVPGTSTPIIDGLSVRVIRVTEEVITEQETIPYDTVYQPDSALELDRRQTVQSGQNGMIERAIRVRYENGVEVSRVQESEELVQAVQNAIIAYGTNVVVRSLDTPQGTVQYWRRLSVYATSYHPAALGGDNVTATGRILEYGVIASDPTIIPYYTNLYVPDYGLGEMVDTGGPRTSPYWIDLGYSDDDFVGWSRLWEVYLLTPVPDTINYLLPESYRGGVLP